MILWAVFIPLAALALLGVRRSVGVVGGVLRRGGGAGAARPGASPGIPAALPARLRGHVLRAEHHGSYRERVRDARRTSWSSVSGHTRARGERERSERLLLNVLPGADRRAPEERDRRDRGALRRGDRALRRPRRLHRAVVNHAAQPSSSTCSTGSSARSTGSPMRQGSRRSRRSATRTWWSAGCRSRGRTTSRRSPGPALAMRDEIAAIAERDRAGLARGADRDRQRAGRRRASSEGASSSTTSGATR